MPKQLVFIAFILASVVSTMAWRDSELPLAVRLIGSAATVLVLGLIAGRVGDAAGVFVAATFIYGLQWATELLPDADALWSWRVFAVATGCAAWAAGMALLSRRLFPAPVVPPPAVEG